MSKRSWCWIVTVVAGLGISPEARAGITGVCPDGSLFIVQRAESIPCARAKTVAPDEVPPIRPELLPQPYTWHVYSKEADPNNPYNLIEAARQVRRLRDQRDAPTEPEASPEVARVEPSALHPHPQANPSSAPSLGLSDDELRDLFLIVELSQEDAPAEFLKETADGRETFILAFAHSEAFETRLRAGHARAAELGDGPVLLFHAVAKQPETFYANLTFSQDHLAFAPDSGNPLQFGLLQGRLGELEPGELTLGYVVLPPSVDLGRRVDVYWNDRHIEALLAP
jgi:hypothetical protein